MIVSEVHVGMSHDLRRLVRVLDLGEVVRSERVSQPVLLWFDASGFMESRPRIEELLALQVNHLAPALRTNR
jgi:Mg-chelatase subunit ChlD